MFESFTAIGRGRSEIWRCKVPETNKQKQDHQALLKTKYFPRVAAGLCTQNNTKKLVTLNFDPWPWNSKEF